MHLPAVETVAVFLEMVRSRHNEPETNTLLVTMIVMYVYVV